MYNICAHTLLNTALAIRIIHCVMNNIALWIKIFDQAFKLNNK